MFWRKKDGEIRIMSASHLCGLHEPVQTPANTLVNDDQFAFGIFRKICALILSLFLAIHKVFLRKSAFIRTQIFSQSALAELIIVYLDFFARANIRFSAPGPPAKKCRRISPSPPKRKTRHSAGFQTVDKVGFCHPERSAAKSKDLKSPCFQDFRSFDSGFASAQDDNLLGLSTP